MSVAADGRPPASDIRVVVVSHQSASTLQDCLQRLRVAAGVGVIRVIDNASSDGSLEIIQRHALADPRIRFVANPDNPGFAVACNQGALGDGEAAPLPWLAFVNPDCLVDPETLVRMRALGSGQDRDVVVGADLIDEARQRDPAARRRHPDFGAMLAAATGRRAAGSASMAIVPDDALELQPVQAISGALMLMPARLFAHLRGFDEHYRLHAEDLDLCRRAGEAGALVAVANHVPVVHVRGVSSRGKPLFVEWHKHRGLWRYFRKFEAHRRSRAVRAAVFAAIWMRFPLAAIRQLLAR